MAIIANESLILVVIGTGGGKSLYFILPAVSYPNRVTVVIILLVAL